MPPDRLPAIPPENITNSQLYSVMQRVDAKQSLHLLKQAELTERFDQFEQDTRDLLAAWRTLDGLYRFLKYVAAVVAAVGVIYLSFTSAAEEFRKWLERS